MATAAAYASTPVIGSALVSVGDATRSGTPASPVTIVTGAATGTRIDNIDLAAIGTTTATALRLWLARAGAYYPALPEQLISAVTPSGSTAAFSSYLASVAGNQLPIVLPDATWSLVATINDTQLITAAQYDSIAQAQTAAAGALLTLNGTNVVAASTTALAAAATIAGAGPMVMTSDPVTLTNPALVSLTSTGNISGVNFTILGETFGGVLTSETIAGPNNNTVFSANAYKIVFGIYASGAVATATSAGYSTVYKNALPSKIMLASFANLSGSTLTITGTSGNGTVLSETLAGPNAGFVQSVNSYSSILTVKAVGALASNITVGNPDILGGIQVTARGGSF